jgi:hypothetical protein
LKIPFGAIVALVNIKNDELGKINMLLCLRDQKSLELEKEEQPAGCLRWFGVISQRRDLNPRPGAYEASALPLSYVGVHPIIPVRVKFLQDEQRNLNE